MQFKKLFIVGAVALATGSVFADEGANDSAPKSRAEVVSEVMQARAQGALTPAGEGVYPAGARVEASSTKTLADSAAEVRQARADGTLRHAGEAAPEELMRYERAHPSTSTLTRAEVKAEVVAARRAGQLVPAGEAEEFSVDRPYARAAATAPRTAMRDQPTAAAGAQ